MPIVPQCVCGMRYCPKDGTPLGAADDFNDVIAKAVAKERDACAKLVREQRQISGDYGCDAYTIEEQIRAREKRWRR